MSRKAYPTDVSDEEWEFVASYLTLLREDARQRVPASRDVFDASRWMVKAGCPWRMLPGDFPPWQAVEQQAKRWMEAGCFEAMTHDLRELLRLLNERNPRPTAAVLDGRTLQSSPESGSRAGDDRCKRKKGSKVHVAVDTWGPLLAVLVTPANEQERAQVAELARQVPQATQRSMRLAYVDQGDTGEKAADAAAAQGIELEVVKQSSNWPKPNAASCSCPGAGWWSDPLPGWLGFDDFRVITSGCQRRWPDCTGWLFRACCSATCSER